jgi:hypothetical protein
MVFGNFFGRGEYRRVPRTNEEMESIEVIEFYLEPSLVILEPV